MRCTYEWTSSHVSASWLGGRIWGLMAGFLRFTRGCRTGEVAPSSCESAPPLSGSTSGGSSNGVAGSFWVFPAKCGDQTSQVGPRSPSPCVTLGRVTFLQAKCRCRLSRDEPRLQCSASDWGAREGPKTLIWTHDPRIGHLSLSTHSHSRLTLRTTTPSTQAKTPNFLTTSVQGDPRLVGVQSCREILSSSEWGRIL